METLMPEALPQANWSSVKIEGMRVGVISDLHVPKHSRAELEASVYFLREASIDHLVLLGDVMESEALSRHSRKKASESDFNNEVVVTKQFLGWLREEFPHIPISWKEGNHDYWYERYIVDNAPAIASVPDISFQSIMGLEKLGIQYHGPENNYVIETEYDNLSLIHGHEIFKSGGVTAAKRLLDKGLSSSICAHLHRTDSHFRNSLDGKRYQAHVLGCLRNLTPEYVRFHQWNHGFALIHNWDKNYHVENKRIFEGRIF